MSVGQTEFDQVFSVKELKEILFNYYGFLMFNVI